jgi:hypothetical protein
LTRCRPQFNLLAAIAGLIVATIATAEGARAANVPDGACCVVGECSYITEHDCDKLGGVYLGNNVICDDNPCDAQNGNTCNTALTAVEGDNPFDTTAATDSGAGDPDETLCPDTYLDWDASPDIWFKWSAPGNGSIDVDTCDPQSYDTSIVLYEGLSCDTLIQVACNGDGPTIPSCQNYASAVEGITVTSGQTYWVRIGGWQGATGAGTMHLNFNGSSEPTGSCCIGIDCLVLTDAQCVAMGGAYNGDGATCFNNPCESSNVGACCVGGNCTVGTEADCDAASGIYFGHGSNCSGNPCNSSGLYTSIHWNVIGVDLLTTGEPSYTVDVYVEVPANFRIDAVAGNPDQQKTVATTTTFYQDQLGGATSQHINPAFFPMAPDLEWDSRVTIGSLNVLGDPFPSNELNEIGIDWTDFEAGRNLAVGNGTWFVLPLDEQGQSQPFIDNACQERNGVLVGRLTSMGHEAEILFEAIFQGRDADNVTWQDVSTRTISYGGELDCNGNTIPDACDIAGGNSNDDNDNGIPDECESECQWDLTSDGMTNVNDLLELIGDFLDTYDVDDLLGLLAEFGCGG